MRLLIAGSRDLFPNMEEITKAFHEMFPGGRLYKDDEVISGTAIGVDRQGERWAVGYGIEPTRFPADWDRYGRKAGYIRNRVMADYCTHAIIFWNGKSSGTKSMIDLMIKSGKPYTVIMKD
jgi:hypothetical protein